MTEYYLVAGHGFSLTLPAKSPLWATLDNYAPFHTAEAETVFSLTVAEDAGAEDAADWQPVLVSNEGPGEPVIDLYRRPGQWKIGMAPVSGMPVSGCLVCDEGFREGTLRILNDRFGRFCVDNALMMMYAFRTADLGTLEMHASVTVRDGLAYLFLGHPAPARAPTAAFGGSISPAASCSTTTTPSCASCRTGKSASTGPPGVGKRPATAMHRPPRPLSCASSRPRRTS